MLRTILIATTAILLTACGANAPKTTATVNQFGDVVLTAEQVHCYDAAWETEKELLSVGENSVNFGDACGIKIETDAYVSGNYEVAK